MELTPIKSEYEAFSVELGALARPLAVQELKDMENGDMWRYLIGTHADS